MTGIRSTDIHDHVGQIIESSGAASRDEYDIDGIVSATYEFDGQVFQPTTTPEEFWQVVEDSSLLVTTEQSAAMWGVKPSTFRAYVARGQAPAPIRHYGRTPMWSRQAVTDALGVRRGQAWRRE